MDRELETCEVAASLERCLSQLTYEQWAALKRCIDGEFERKSCKVRLDSCGEGELFKHISFALS